MSAARRRDKKATQHEILNAAEELFSLKGFAATSLTEIATLAQVTKSLIHHHFGTKAQLWNAVKQHHFEEYKELQGGMLSTDDMDPRLLELSIDAYFAFLSSRPRLARMLGWMGLEQMDGSTSEPPGMDLIHMGVEKIARAQEQGIIRQDLDPLNIILTYIFAVDHWFLCGPLLCPILQGEMDQATSKEFLRNIKEIILHGVLVKPSGRQP